MLCILVQAEEARSRDLLSTQRTLALAIQPLVHALPAKDMPAMAREAWALVDGGGGWVGGQVGGRAGGRESGIGFAWQLRGRAVKGGVRRRARPQLVAVG